MGGRLVENRSPPGNRSGRLSGALFFFQGRRERRLAFEKIQIFKESMSHRFGKQAMANKGWRGWLANAKKASIDGPRLFSRLKRIGKRRTAEAAAASPLWARPAPTARRGSPSKAPRLFLCASRGLAAAPALGGLFSRRFEGAGPDPCFPVFFPLRARPPVSAPKPRPAASPHPDPKPLPKKCGIGLAQARPRSARSAGLRARAIRPGAKRAMAPPPNPSSALSPLAL